MLFTLFFLGALVVGAGVGYYKYNQVRRAKDAANRFEMAINQIQLGQHETARNTLETLLEDFPTLPERDIALATLAESCEATGDMAQARQYWQAIIDEYPGSSRVPYALNFVAERLYAEGKRAEALKYWELIRTNFAESDAVADATFGQLRATYDEEGPESARNALFDYVERFPQSARTADAEEMLGRVNLELLYSPTLQPGDQIYTIQRGDTLDSIGKRFGVSPDLLARINGIAPERIRSLSVGRRLKVPKVNFSILVDKTENTLLLRNDGKFFKRYRCRTGTDDWRTPNGTFRILSKVKNPTWNDPVSGKTFPPNDPGNELGTRWLAFEGALGIHGTINPATIGGYASNGCVGLLMEDVEELYDLVPLGTEVQITGKMTRRGR